MEKSFYGQITVNKWKSFALVFLFFIFVVGLGFVIGYAWGGRFYIGMGIAFVIAVVMALVSYFQSDTIALKISGARPVEDGEYTRYRTAVDGLAIAAGVPTPRIYVIDSPAMNAFATGRNPQNSAVAVTTGLLETMNDLELQGVVGHEMSHIKNYDILLMTITIVLLGTIILLSDIFLRTFWFGGDDGGGDGEGTAYLMIIGIVLAIIAPIIAQLIRMAISRRREYLADASSALLTRYPPGLADALGKLTTEQRQLKTANKAMAHMFIVQPLKTGKGERGSWFNRMFDTHPPLEDRIQRLREMQGSFAPDGSAQAPGLE